MAEELVALMPSDYPDYFKDCAHPDDYKVFGKPVFEAIDHYHMFHSRLHVRLSWRLAESAFLPMTFVVDTGAPRYFYLCRRYGVFMRVLGLLLLLFPCFFWQAYDYELGEATLCDCVRAYEVLETHKRIEGSEDDVEGSRFVRYGPEALKAALTRTPPGYEPSNIVGLGLIKQHGGLIYKKKSFAFEKPFPEFL